MSMKNSVINYITNILLYVWVRDFNPLQYNVIWEFRLGWISIIIEIVVYAMMVEIEVKSITQTNY